MHRYTGKGGEVEARVQAAAGEVEVEEGKTT